MVLFTGMQGILFLQHVFQRVQPDEVVVLVIGYFLIPFKFTTVFRKQFGPFFPCKKSRLVETNGQGKSLCLPGGIKNGVLLRQR